MARFVEPVAGHLRELVAYRKFRGDESGRGRCPEGGEGEGQQAHSVLHLALLRAPGVFRLSYIRTAAAKHEYLSVTPQVAATRGITFAA